MERLFTCNCVILDDEKLDRLTLPLFAAKYPFLNNFGNFASTTEAHPIIKSKKIAIILFAK